MLHGYSRLYWHIRDGDKGCIYHDGEGELGFHARFITTGEDLKEVSHGSEMTYPRSRDAYLPRVCRLHGCGRNAVLHTIICPLAGLVEPSQIAAKLAGVFKDDCKFVVTFWVDVLF